MHLNKKFSFGIITLFIFFIGIISPTFVFAVEPVAPAPVYFCGQVDIPIIGGIFKKSDPTKAKEASDSKCTKIDTSSIAKLASDMYRFIAGIAGIAAVIVMMAGGYIWLFAGGNASKVGEAKSLITSAVLGLFLVLGSYTILNLINPKLIQLPKIDTGTIGSITMKGVDRICTAKEDIEIEKKESGNGCGKVYTYIDPKSKKSASCMRVSCVIPNLFTGKHTACVIIADEKGYLTGGNCEETIRVINVDQDLIDDSLTTSEFYNSSDALMTSLQVKQKTPERVKDRYCGVVENNKTTMANDCIREGDENSGYSDKNTCVMIKQTGSDHPAIESTKEGDFVSSTYEKKKYYMRCRSESAFTKDLK